MWGPIAHTEMFSICKSVVYACKRVSMFFSIDFKDWIKACPMILRKEYKKTSEKKIRKQILYLEFYDTASSLLLSLIQDELSFCF